MGKITANLISHTHWDREWYLPMSEFMVDLVSLIDRVLMLLDQSKPEVCFLMDGQTIALKDYLVIRPENRAKIEMYLASGRLLCGPWYVLPDELLISGESHIRNYLAATDISNVKTAYLPDSFGHPEQIPQIVAGLGLEGMPFWRGLPLSVNKSEFIWQSPCPDYQILCVHLPSGYGNGARLERDDIVERLDGLLTRLAASSNTDKVLLMNGSDHIAPQLDIVELSDYYNRESNIGEIKLSSPDEHIRMLYESLDKSKLEVYTGELRSGERAMLLGGTLSARMYLKQWNFRVTVTMERYLEPITALSNLAGISVIPKGYSRYIWESILENLPHDSICGCSIDDVHEEMIVRYKKIWQMENKLINDTFNKFARQDSDFDQAWLVGFEPTTDRLPCYLEVDIDIDAELFQDVNFSKSLIVRRELAEIKPSPKGLTITDQIGREIPHLLLGCKEFSYQRIQSHTTPEIFRVNRARVAMLLPANDFGYGTLKVARSDTPSKQVITDGENHIENEFYRLEANAPTGDFILTDKRSGRKYNGIHRLIDKGDAGDEYSYSWPKHDKVISCSSLEVSREIIGAIAQKLTIKGVMELPEQLTNDRQSRSDCYVACPIRVTATLVSGQQYVHFHTEFENNACDHRLQVEYPCGVLADKSSSLSSFALTPRSVSTTVPREWVEYPQSTHPSHGLAFAEENGVGAAVFMRGLTEYEAENSEEETLLRVTLLRCVGWLSREDLLSRKGPGGWVLETPGAQCLGKHEFETAYMPYGGDTVAERMAACDRFLHPVRLNQTRWGEASTGKSFKLNLPPGVRLSACKLPHQGEGLIIRVYNITREQTTLKLTLPLDFCRAYKTNLAEVCEYEIPVEDGEIEVSLKSAEIYTMLFR